MQAPSRPRGRGLVGAVIHDEPAGAAGLMQTFQEQGSLQTLAEGIAEYFAANPGLTRGVHLSGEAAAFFSCHDAAHVVFGCSTSLDDEMIVKISSLFGTTAGFGVLKGYRLHESIEIYGELRAAEVLASLLHSFVLVPRTVWRCSRQRARWPWSEYQQYLATPLGELRRRFGIVVAHGSFGANEA